MPSSSSKILSICIVILGFATIDGLAAPTPSSPNEQRDYGSRRAFVSTSALATAFLATTNIANARFVLNEQTGDYDEVLDEDWQTTWGKRLDKAKSMDMEDVFLAAQGAGNTNLREGEESEASKKRRALAGCRNDRLRQMSGVTSSQECTARVLQNDYKFMIDAM